MKLHLKLIALLTLGSAMFFSCKDDEKTEVPIDNLAIEKAEVSMEVKQQATVAITAGSGVYSLKNSNSAAVDATLTDKIVTLEGKKEGEAVVTVTDDKTKQTQKITVKVLPKTPDLKLEKTATKITQYESKTVRIRSGSGNYSVASDLPEIATASVKEDIVTIEALKGGKAIITVTDTKSSQTQEIAVTVIKIPDLVLDKNKVEMQTGGSTKVAITSGSGSYEVANENTEIATAELKGSNIIIKSYVTIGNTQITVTDTTTKQTQTIEVTVTKREISYERVLIKGGTFKMGSPDGVGLKNERPQHEVTISKDFYIGKNVVTNAQFAEFLNDRGNQTEGGGYETWLDINDQFCQIIKVNGKYQAKEGLEDYPVIDVNWYGARAYARWIGGRLPTEAEWEYVARAGSETHKYSGSDNIDEVAWYWTNSFNDENDMYKGRGTHKVGTKKANEFGVYDMTGNVWEWCNDWYAPYEGGKQVDPQGPKTGSAHPVRGAGWDSNLKYCRIAFRFYLGGSLSSNAMGFRVAFDK